MAHLPHPQAAAHAAILRKFCEQEGLSYSALARLLGVTPGAVSEWCRGVERVTPTRAVQIERVTGGKLRREAFHPELYT